MITNTGKRIITKYLIGQVPSYASYIALGCGAAPLSSTTGLADYSQKTSLDFEMIRVPVTSRGLVVENGVEKIVLTAQLPTEERYEITEVGLYPAVSNPIASGYDSRTLYSFGTNESWLTTSALDNVIPSVVGQIDFTTADTVFQSTADNTTLVTQERSERLERPRFLNNSIFIKGDSCQIDVVDFSLTGTSDHIYTSTANLDLSKNSPLDELRIAYSVLTADPADTTSSPDAVNIIVEFSSTQASGLSSGIYARANISNTSITTSNRYFVESIPLNDLVYSTVFSWNDIKYVKIFAGAEVSSVSSGDYYICVDAIRLENLASLNSVYGMTGYSVIVNPVTDISGNTYPSPTIKELNTSNYIEFRFQADVTA